MPQDENATAVPVASAGETARTVPTRSTAAAPRPALRPALGTQRQPLLEGRPAATSDPAPKAPLSQAPLSQALGTAPSATDVSFARIESARTAAPPQLAIALRALTDGDVVALARSLEFEAILEGQPPELLPALRPRLRQIGPPRVASVERMCWAPVQHFLTDREQGVPKAPWIVPRRLLAPLWALVEARNPDLVDQLRRRLLVALFDRDEAAVQQVAIRIGDLAAFVLNNTRAESIPGITPADAPIVTVIARVLKWHRLIMPNVRYYQQVARAAAENTVQSLRLHTNWYTVYELLEEQFDLYVLYLFEMTPSPIDVIDAFPFYFDTLKAPEGLAMDWLAYRCDGLAAVIADHLGRPLRSQSPERLAGLFDAVHELARLSERLMRLPMLRGVSRVDPLARGLLDAVIRRVPPEAVERSVDAYLDDLHDAMMGPPDKMGRAQRLLPQFSVALPVLLGQVDTGDKANRAAKARFRLVSAILDTVDRYLRNAQLAPQTRRAMAPLIAPAMEMCRKFGLAEDTEALMRKMLR